MEDKKNLEVISGDGTGLDISPVYEHIYVPKPKSAREKPKNIVIPKPKEKKEHKNNKKEEK